jgi:hypothetical protein
MIKLKSLIWVFILIMPILLIGTSVRLDQKNGHWQSQPDKQIRLKSFERLEIDFEKMPLKLVTKIVMRDNKIFFLDNKRSELYVTDKSGKYLYTIGRPGQGPGDIEYGWDFHIAGDRVFVLSNMSKRISAFKTNGEPIGIIKLEDTGGLSLPLSIAVDKQQNIVIGGAFDPVVSLFSPEGKFKKILVDKKSMVTYKDTPPKFGIPSSIEIYGDTIFHFDTFKGIMTKLDSSGNIDAVFSADRDYIDNDLK